MLPSSRTPEGSPVDCPTCGKSSQMEYSIPPGDVTCPHCGSLVWQGPVRNYLQGTKTRIANLVAEIAQLSRGPGPVEKLETAVVSELVTCLGAYAGMVWTIGRQTRKPHCLRTLWLECQVNQSPFDPQQVDLFQASDFVWSVVDERAPQQLATAIGPLLITRLAVPVVKEGQCCRVIEVLHKPDVQTPVKDNYLQFMLEIGDIFAEVPILST